MNVVKLKRSIQVGGVCLLASLFLSTASFADGETGHFDVSGADSAPADLAAQSAACTENCDETSGEAKSVELNIEDLGDATDGLDIEQIGVAMAFEATNRGVSPDAAAPVVVNQSGGIMTNDECQRMFPTNLEFCAGLE